MNPSTRIYIVLYLVCLTAVFLGMRRARTSAVAAYGTSKAQTEWESWRKDVREHAPTKGATKRRVPKSDTPPALVLMKDYYVPCMVFSMVMASALYWTTVIVFRGAMRPTVVRDD